MEEIKVYNTLTREKSIFKPITPGEVKIYVCGVTPYNHPHIGNARPAVTWDVIRRYLQHIGYKVTLVQNFTDVDDKIINKANAEGVSWKEVADTYIESYFAVIDALHVKRVDIYPRVSEHMKYILAMVQKLIENGHAYVLDGDVYYDISTFHDYGKLSGRNIEDMLAGARVEVNEGKRNPGDFALWKAVKPGEPSWPSPWGNGRPGWHIECSAMSIHYLGDTFDFHGGGSDLIFPHHENEIAQSEGCTCHPFVHYWLHNGFITINQEKMSKSLNNFFLVKDVLKKYSPDALRFFLLSTHYRSPLDFSEESLEAAETNMARLTDVIDRIRELAGTDSNEETEESRALAAAADTADTSFHEAMDDDFNTALASGSLFDLARAINIYDTAVRGGIPADRKTAARAMEVLRMITDILGILEEVWDKKEDFESEDFKKLMDTIIEIRQEARKEKLYSIADKIRDRLADMNITIEDTPDGARWKKRGL